ncbi:MAG: hypothetical protein GY803_21970 [Chloroflexi bacterium]|nr:hypothetical protein [Chloroflexota bacterium]
MDKSIAENPIETRVSDRTPQARAARATYLLMQRGEMTTAALMNELGYRARQSVYHLLDGLSLADVPVFQPREGYWAISE